MYKYHKILAFVKFLDNSDSYANFVAHLVLDKSRGNRMFRLIGIRNTVRVFLKIKILHSLNHLGPLNPLPSNKYEKRDPEQKHFVTL